MGANLREQGPQRPQRLNSKKSSAGPADPKDCKARISIPNGAINHLSSLDFLVICCLAVAQKGRETWSLQGLFSSRLQFSKIRDAVGSSMNPTSDHSFKIWCWRSHRLYFLSGKITASNPPIWLRSYFLVGYVCLLCGLGWSGRSGWTWWGGDAQVVI